MPRGRFFGTHSLNEHPLFEYDIYGRGGRNRTLLWSFGDSHSTDELHPYSTIILLFLPCIVNNLCKIIKSVLKNFFNKIDKIVCAKHFLW